MNIYGAINMTLAKESLLLIVICMTDLLSTMVLLSNGQAVEGNPIMAYYLNYGIGAFVAVKLVLIFFPVYIAEWGMQYKPQFVRTVLRATIGLYIGLYLLVVLALNVSNANVDGKPIYLPPTWVTNSK